MTFSSLSSARMQEERKRLGLKQAEVAAGCGVSREVWGRYERGVAAPGGEVLYAFANLGADVQYILTGSHAAPAALPADEQLLLERYRKSPEALKDAALRVLLGDASQQSTIQESAPSVGKIGGSGHRFSVKGDYYEQGKPKK